MHYLKVTYAGRSMWDGPYLKRRAEREAAAWERRDCTVEIHPATPAILTQVRDWQIEATRVVWSA